VDVPAGHVVFKQGGQPDSMYFVEFGTVTVWLELPNGERTRLRTMGMGTVIGEMGFYLGIPRSGTVVTANSCVLYRFSLASYQRMNAEDPELASSIHQFMVRLLANHLAYANKQLVN
jgi:CRP-like cAMP-binding protein